MWWKVTRTGARRSRATASAPVAAEKRRDVAPALLRVPPKPPRAQDVKQSFDRQAPQRRTRWRNAHVPGSRGATDGQEPDQVQVRQFHRRQVRRAGRGPLFRQPDPDHRPGAVQDRALDRRRHRTRARRRPRGQGRLGPDLGRRALADPATRSPTAWSRTSTRSRWSRRSTTASRSARRPTPTCRSASTIGAISLARCAPRKARSPRSTTTPSPITSMSRSASSARSFPGTSRC